MSKSPKTDASQAEIPAPRHGWARPAGETVLREAGGAFARAGFVDATFLIRWADIAGAQIARVARPAKWQDGPEGAILTLKCEAGAIVFLQHQTRELTDRLNTYLGRGRIARLRLVPGRLERAAEPCPHPAPTSDPPSQTRVLSEALDRLSRARTSLKVPRSKPRD